MDTREELFALTQYQEYPNYAPTEENAYIVTNKNLKLRRMPRDIIHHIFKQLVWANRKINFKVLPSPLANDQKENIGTVLLWKENGTVVACLFDYKNDKHQGAVDESELDTVALANLKNEDLYTIMLKCKVPTVFYSDETFNATLKNLLGLRAVNKYFRKVVDEFLNKNTIKLLCENEVDYQKKNQMIAILEKCRVIPRFFSRINCYENDIELNCHLKRIVAVTGRVGLCLFLTLLVVSAILKLFIGENTDANNKLSICLTVGVVSSVIGLMLYLFTKAMLNEHPCRKSIRCCVPGYDSDDDDDSEMKKKRIEVTKDYGTVKNKHTKELHEGLLQHSIFFGTNQPETHEKNKLTSIVVVSNRT